MFVLLDKSLPARTHAFFLYEYHSTHIVLAP